MPDYCGVEDLKSALKQEHSDDDTTLALYAAAANAGVANYLGAKASDPGMEVRAEVRAAAVFLALIMFRNPDNDENSAFEQGYLPKPVTALLYPLRTPSVA